MNQRDRVLPLLLIAVGSIWLLHAVGFVPPSLTAALLRFWPLLLIGAGLDLLAPDRRIRGVPFVAVAALAILVLGVAWPGGTGTTLAGERDVVRSVPPEARRIELELRASSPYAFATAAGSSDTLVAARFAGRPVGIVTVTPGEVTRVLIDSERSFGAFPAPRSAWDIELPRSLPLGLTVDGGSGPVRLDLTSTRLTALAIDAGSGPVNVALPGGGQPYGLEVDGGSGTLELTFAPGASVDGEMDLGSGSAKVLVGEGSDVRLVIETGSGPLELDLPDSAPIRLSVQDDGSGPLRLPAFLERRSGRGDTGVWESPSLRNGGRVIDIVLSDVGSGPITVR